MDEVSILASDLATATGIKERFPSICDALGGKKFQDLAKVPAPRSTEPNPSSSTIFTYQLISQAKADPVTEVSKAAAIATTNLIL